MLGKHAAYGKNHSLQDRRTVLYDVLYFVAGTQRVRTFVPRRLFKRLFHRLFLRRTDTEELAKDETYYRGRQARRDEYGHPGQQRHASVPSEAQQRPLQPVHRENSCGLEETPHLQPREQGTRCRRMEEGVQESG